MNGFLIMLRMNMKLLLRNKGYIALMLILPIIAVLMLSVDDQNTFTTEESSYVVHDLASDNERIFNMKSIQLSVKVYDCSQSELSDYILKELAKTGSYQIYRLKSKPMDTEEARMKALASANRNVIGSVVYIPASFDTQILSGKTGNAEIFVGTEDGRNRLLEGNLNSLLQSLCRYAGITGYDRAKLSSLLNTLTDNELAKKTVSVEVGNGLNLTGQQQSSSMSIGYSIAFLTLAFIFSGVFIAANIVEERNLRVYNRILLSSSSLISYGLVKLVIILITVLLQTGIIAAAIKLLLRTEFGISYASYLLLVFCLGLIFNLFSVVIGVLTNNVLTSNYIAFLTWCLSCVLAGLYFPLDSASSWWSKISMLMPQRWAVKTGEMLMAGKSNAYSMYLLVIVSYLFIILSVGFMGIKMRKKD